MGLTSDVGDRIHLINQQLSPTIKRASRYFPDNFDVVPCIFFEIGAETKYIQPAGAQQFSAERTWIITVIVGKWMARQPIASVSADAEACIDAITESYMTRPRLEYNGAPLSWVERAELGSDDGVFQYGDDYAALRFPLTVTTRRSVTYNTTN